jgi:hypothetical protein
MLALPVPTLFFDDEYTYSRLQLARFVLRVFTESAEPQTERECV